MIAAPSYEKIEQAKERISSGEDFESVAKEVSRFSQIEYQVSRGTLNPILEETAIYMSDGEVSDIIQTEQKYYLKMFIRDRPKGDARADLQDSKGYWRAYF